VDVRILAATNRDIIDAIEAGDFREDLYHRLNVVQLRVVPLRDRDGDVTLLAEHFLSGFARKMNKQFQPLSSEVQHMLNTHHWPGNVRELRNTIERAVILATSDVIYPVNLPDFRLETRLRKEDDLGISYEGLALEEALASFERDMIRAELARNNSNLSKTAQKLGISRHALRYRMTRLQLTSEGGADDEDKPNGE
jgi:transcriptional regulator with PAS, ATPase and Fis domain